MVYSHQSKLWLAFISLSAATLKTLAEHSQNDESIAHMPESFSFFLIQNGPWFSGLMLEIVMSRTLENKA